MISKKYCNLFFLFFFGLHLSKSQSLTITGKVVNEKDVAIEFATVIIYNINQIDSTIIQFTNSKANGVYTLTFDKDSSRNFLLKVNALGYEQKQIYFELDDRLSFVFNILMVEGIVELDEVIVKGKKNAVEINGDTTVYNLKSFLRGNEKNLEDVLKRLPNIKVDKDGNISANGKSISKILIEGDDVFSSNYKLISKNLGPNVIEKIEAIDHFNDNPILKEIKNSNEIVLNLKINKNEKIKPFGSVSLSGSQLLRGEVAANVFSIKEKLKLGIVQNANNVGFDPLPDAEYHLHKTVSSNVGFFMSGIFANESNIINTKLPTFSIINNDKFLRNKTGLLGQSLNFKLSKKIKVLGIIYGLSATQRLNRVNETVFFGSNNTEFKFVDRDSLYRAPKLFSGSLQFDYTISKKSYLRLIASNTMTNVNSRNRTISNNNIFSDTLTQNAKSSQFNRQLLTNFSHKINDKKYLDINLKYENFKVPQQIFSNSKRYGLDSLNKNNILNDDINVKSENFNAEITLFTKGSLFKNKISFVFKNENEILKNHKTNTLIKNIFLVNDEFEYKINSNVKLGVAGTLGLVKIDNKNTLFFTPLLFCNIITSSSSKLLLLYSKIVTPPTILENYKGSVWANYRTKMYGFDSLTFAKSDFYSFNYNLALSEKLLFFTTSVSYNKANNNLINQVILNSKIAEIFKVFYAPSISYFSHNLSLNKKIDAIETSFSINTNTKLDDFKTSFEKGLILSGKRKTFLYNLSANTNFDLFINFEVGTQKNTSNVLLETSNIKNTITENYINLHLNFNKKIISKIQYSTNTWTSVNINTKLNFLDFSTTFLPEKGKLNYELSITNILNKKNIKLETLASNSRNIDQFEIFPTQLFLKINYKL